MNEFGLHWQSVQSSLEMIHFIFEMMMDALMYKIEWRPFANTWTWEFYILLSSGSHSFSTPSIFYAMCSMLIQSSSQGHSIFFMFSPLFGYGNCSLWFGCSFRQSCSEPPIFQVKPNKNKAKSCDFSGGKFWILRIPDPLFWAYRIGYLVWTERAHLN